jgi:flavin reductase (DIM6/NTAB) family NADH-FMN oxidoreductase RutF
MHVKTEEMHHAELYRLLAALVVPRPIALITSVDRQGVVNAAPYSFFNILSDDPPVMAFGAASRACGRLKDTADNIEATGEFVVNMVHGDILERMNICSAAIPSGLSEPALAGLGLADSVTVRVPRIDEALVSYECKHRETMILDARSRIVFGTIGAIRIADHIIDAENMRIKLEAYRPVGRLFGQLYTRISEIVELKPVDADELVQSAKVPV